MNSRQRRGVILLALSVLCALAAFAGVLSVISDVDSKVGPEVTAYELNQDIPAYRALTAGQFTKVSMPQRWLPSTAVTDLSGIGGKIAEIPLKKGSLLQTDMISAQPELQPGEQEIAIMVDSETGVAGKINPGNQVNIYATFAGNQQGQKAISKIIVTNARVIDIGQISKPGQTDQNSPDRATSKVPVTFALQTQDAQRVAYAESFATHVRLALIAPGSDTTIPSGDRTYTLEGDK